jgi:hypothetical protein
MNSEIIERKDLSEVLGKTAQQSNPSLMLVQVFLCILIAGFTVYAYIDKHNELTELRLAIPALAKEVKQIQEENIRLMYDINQFESPIHLMQLARKPEFGHLKYPYFEDEIILLEGKITDDVQR